MDFLENLLGHDYAKVIHQQVYNGSNNHKISWTHELIAGTAGFAAMQAYEHHLVSTGETPSYAVMKKL
ncbi:hypothetical protein BV898_04201 [Hypsibius exemplaris]|uniref:Uncharacterized protein n=1 Tax=Hypsibius exemplaris TaxID=2072580 RepID=A0A1W0X3I5_HYPEX|nr:hypothetical protein BV898_04201 [Hypsibius exemplaris]